MSEIEIRLLGAFEVRSQGRLVSGFESQKVRALLAYLAVAPAMAHDRSHLATLLWPERREETARRNLRQAAYNLHRALESSDGGGRPPALVRTRQSLQLNPEAGVWVDVPAFERAATLGLRSGIEADISGLSEAAGLYQGHLLPAFVVKESEDYSDWLHEKREQLRELAVRNLRALVGCYLEQGDYALGIDHAQALVELDPLSEEAHRTLIHLYFLAGRRSQALLHYQSFAERIEHELQVKPLAETTALYESILSDSAPGPLTARRIDPVGPFVTLEGRDRELRRLHRVWEDVLRGRNRIVLVDGAPGVGKSRLVKTFLHQATSKAPAAVLRGRAYDLTAPRVYGIVTDLLRNAMRFGQAEDRHRFLGLRHRDQARLAELLPDLGEQAGLDGDDVPPVADDRAALFAAVTGFLHTAVTPVVGADATPIIIFVDDAHWADPASLDYLESLLADDRPAKLLVVMTYRADQVGPEQIDALLRIRRLPIAERLRVESVGTVSVRRMVDSIAAVEDRGPLTRFLQKRSKGHPLVITETINSLWDFGHMSAATATRVRLRDYPEAIDGGVPRRIDEIVRRRVERLPESTRRLLSHAALIGHRFDFHLLRQAADEHALVVETAIGLMLSHWLGRQFPDAWASSHQERDIVLWAQGARRGTYEIAHR